MSTPSPPIIDKHIHRDGDEEADTSSDANGDADGDGDEGNQELVQRNIMQFLKLSTQH